MDKSKCSTAVALGFIGSYKRLQMLLQEPGRAADDVVQAMSKAAQEDALLAGLWAVLLADQEKRRAVLKGRPGQ